MDDQLKSIRKAFKLPASLARLLDLLLDNGVVPIADIERDIAPSAKVAVMRLRRKLDADEVRIESMRNFGYWLADDQKERIRGILSERG